MLVTSYRSSTNNHVMIFDPDTPCAVLPHKEKGIKGAYFSDTLVTQLLSYVFLEQKKLALLHIDTSLQ